MKKSSRLFWKIFWRMLGILLILLVAAYMLVYLLLPKVYKDYKSKSLDELMVELVGQLKESDKSEESSLLSQYAQKNDLEISVTGEDGQEIFEYYTDDTIVESTVSDSEVSIGVAGADTLDTISKTYQYTLDGELHTINITLSLQPLNEAKEVIIRIYPYASLVCLLFSIIAAFWMSKLIVDPIQNIKKVTREMTMLESQARIEIHSGDEIEELSRDINELYIELTGVIEELRNELDYISKQENKRIDFFRTLSHEMKNPLAAVNSLIEGIIYDVEPYCNDTRKYLSECLGYLGKITELIKESLYLTKEEYREEETKFSLKWAIDSEFKTYRMISRSRGIEYENRISEEISIYTREILFRKVISNLISNAVKYTSQDGKMCFEVVEKDEGEWLRAYNDCRPMTKAEIVNAFEPFTVTDDSELQSTGLGLYIVKQILNSLGMRYDFVAVSEGMEFWIRLA